MKHLFIILSFTGILLQTFYSGLILTNYVMNKDYISKNLCENKNKPGMHCNGKCHLRKQLAEQQKKENSPLQDLKEKLEVQFFSEANHLSFAAVPTEHIPFHSNYSFFIPTTALESIFHPPPFPVSIS